MTKRHFIAFANRIAADLDETRKRFPARFQEMAVTANYAAQTFASVAVADNPRFDRARFIEACGINAPDVMKAIEREDVLV